MANLQDFYPRLVKSNLRLESGECVLHLEQTGRRIWFPAEDQGILGLLDGTRSIRDIVSETFAQQGRISIKRFLRVLTTLRDHDCLDNGDELPNSSLERLADPSKVQGFWTSALWRHTLVTTTGVGREHPYLFSLLVAVSILGGAFALWWWRDSVFGVNFLRPGGHYAHGLLFVLWALSFLRISHGLFQALLHFCLTGFVNRLNLEFQILGLKIESDLCATRAKQDRTIFVVALSSTLIVPAMAAGLGALLDITWARELMGIALLYMLALTTPFGKSDFTFLVSSKLDSSDRLHLLPYLRHKAIFSLFSKERVEGERELLLYSAYALSWVFVALWTTLAIGGDVVVSLLADLPFTQSSLVSSSIAAAPVDSPLVDGIAALILLGILIASLGAALAKIIKLVSGNVLTPFSKQIQELKKKRSFSVESKSATWLAQRLQELPLFSHLGNDFLAELAKTVEIRRYRAKGPLLLQGEPATEAYILLEGQVAVQRREGSGLVRKLATMGPGSIFGESGLQEGARRTADVVAQDTVLALVLPPHSLHLLGGDESASGGIMHRILVAQYFQSSPLFRGMPPELMHLCIESATEESVQRGDIIIEENDIGHDFYCLLRGSVEVKKGDESIRNIGVGGFFGEIALFADIPRTATVIARESTLLLKLNREAFWNMLSSNFQLGAFLEDIAHHRQRATEEGLSL